MNKITEKILEKFPYDSFSNADITNLLNSSRNSTYGRVKRAIANKEIREFACLNRTLQYIIKDGRRDFAPTPGTVTVFG